MQKWSLPLFIPCGLLTFVLHFCREREREDPIPNVKPEQIKTVVIFAHKGRFVPILEHSTGNQVGIGSITEVWLGWDLLIQCHQLVPL